MSYEPTQWKAGDTVTSAKLNKIEQGITNGQPLIIERDTTGVITLNNITYEMIEDAILNGSNILLKWTDGYTDGTIESNTIDYMAAQVITFTEEIDSEVLQYCTVYIKFSQEVHYTLKALDKNSPLELLY